MVIKGDVVIKNAKHTDQRMHKLEVAIGKQQFNCEIDNNGDSRLLTYILN